MSVMFTVVYTYIEDSVEIFTKYILVGLINTLKNTSSEIQTFVNANLTVSILFSIVSIFVIYFRLKT
jgi:hypothetical protein